MKAIERAEDRLLLPLRVQPSAGRDELVRRSGQLKARIAAAPVDGEANAHLCDCLARLFGVAKRQVEILSGETGRSKRISIERPAQIHAALAQNL